MAKVQKSSNNHSSMFKLFGATISVKQISQANDDNEGGPERSDPTSENKPDKIIPCPRCKSMETKFCYFNNYNVNQPRHFCKGCQRYWTAGGVLRDVPVGAGRRKNKPPHRGLSEGCLYDHASALQQLNFEEAEVHGGFEYFYPAKRRRYAPPNSQSC